MSLYRAYFVPGGLDSTGLVCEARCCCCVDDFRQVVIPFDIAVAVGHSILTTIELSYEEKDQNNDCTLEWWEWIDVEIHDGMNLREWTNLVELPSTANSFGEWSERDTQCPGMPTVPDDDRPHLTRDVGRTESRTLLIVAIVKSGDGCQCANPFFVAGLHQVLELRNGETVKHKMDGLMVQLNVPPFNLPPFN